MTKRLHYTVEDVVDQCNGKGVFVSDPPQQRKGGVVNIVQNVLEFHKLNPGPKISIF